MKKHRDHQHTHQFIIQLNLNQEILLILKFYLLIHLYMQSRYCKLLL